MSARHPDLELPLDAPALPPRIGKYLITQTIGSGAMGVVYKGVDPHIQRPVAIKTIRPALLAAGGNGPDAVRHFRQEAQAAGRLNHPNIVAVYEYGEQDDEFFIAMECVEGRSLYAITGAGARLSLADVTAVMLQLLDALHVAHEQRVWHCDIKPGNLLVTRDGRLKVTDFGIARLDASDLSQRGTVLGSPGYMAPERYRGETADHRVDLFACGVLLHELLTGVAPFNGSANEAMRQVLTLEPPPASSRPGSVSTPALDAVVARALAKRPADRFPNALAMRQALIDAVPSDAVRHALSPAALVTMRRTPTGAQPSWGSGAVSQPAVAAAPPSPPSVGAPTWDAAALAQVEAILKPTLGPVSGAVVRDASRRSASLSALVARIANEALPRAERAGFLARVAQVTGMAPVAAPAARPVAAGGAGAAPALPVLGQTPMQPEVVDKAARVLARHIGPIASVHARRAAAAATSREQFFCALADRAGPEVDRKRLLEQLWRIA
jgi:eukaryotic-like serine/threonine-protein kinase